MARRRAHRRRFRISSLIPKLPRLRLPTMPVSPLMAKARARIPAAATGFSAYDLLSRLHPEARQSLMVWLFLMATPVLLYLYILAPGGYAARRELNRVIAQRQTAVEARAAANARLAVQLRNLATDTYTIEGVAREELNLVRPDETVYRVNAGSQTSYVYRRDGERTSAVR